MLIFLEILSYTLKPTKLAWKLYKKGAFYTRDLQLKQEGPFSSLPP